MHGWEGEGSPQTLYRIVGVGYRRIMLHGCCWFHKGGLTSVTVFPTLCRQLGQSCHSILLKASFPLLFHFAGSVEEQFPVPWQPLLLFPLARGVFDVADCGATAVLLWEPATRKVCLSVSWFIYLSDWLFGWLVS